ncbi:MAG: lasso peptide biosynthesis protein [Oscillospiraceae bacterium]|nr:lasso peptide biosynthesis protein [Oscillospiraceae bacterium]
MKKANDICSLISDEFSANSYSENLINAVCSLYRYMKLNRWTGACHASSAVLYVVLRELGYKPRLCIGEVYGKHLYFDHSWIELDGKVIDLAISMTLFHHMAVTGPVILDKDVVSGKKTAVRYGVPGRGIEEGCSVMMNTPFTLYMDLNSSQNDHLWDIVSIILDKKIDIDRLSIKYRNVQRELVRI